MSSQRAGSDLSDMHELNKLDEYLGVPPGTSCRTVISHGDPSLLNEKLREHGIVLDKYGMVLAKHKPAWKKLMESAGIDKRYWKDKETMSLPPVELVEL